MGSRQGLTPWAARRPLFALLGTFQVLAAAALLPFAVVSPGGRGDLAEGLFAAGWLALAAVNLFSRLRPARWTFELSLYAAALMVALQVGLSARPHVGVVGGLELMVLGLFAAFCAGTRTMYVWLAVAGGGFVLALGLQSPEAAVAGLLAAAMIAATAATVRVLLKQVVHASEHDPLTGALNRLGLRDRAELVRAYAHRRGEPTAVALLDIDRFKSYNDRLGHAAGDRLLIDVATRLQRELRRSDLVARLGGDEFVVVLVGADAQQAQTILARILPDMPVGCSYGIAAWETDGDLAKAIDQADHAMYTRRRRIRGGVAH